MSYEALGCPVCGCNTDDQGWCVMCGTHEDDAPEDLDEDDFDPNECPDCGQELVFGVCIDSSCMWRPEDDLESEETE